ncbi:uncharacterized protein LOC124920755 [Impatiens glandulifera]|uniref:uncharacterized protein LOC124920755 n=1 Tax=Impatiens glandulifera TaxID=253017 RepID=UPI001FB0F651|nr:uncharacterized protein LOC124920755 [Impatiens glandulifera]
MLASVAATLNPGSLPATAIAHGNRTHLDHIQSIPSRGLCFPLVAPDNRTLNLATTVKCGGKVETRSVRTAVAAVDSLDLAEKEQASNKYYFVVANAKFMLDEEEHFKELMFERLRLFEERNKEQDFWLVIEPKFLDKFPNITKRLKRPAVALVSTNGPWITFMKLRLDRVLCESYEADNVEEALASNPTVINFPEPEKWTAPYKKYESGWWESFLPPKTA